MATKYEMNFCIQIILKKLKDYFLNLMILEILIVTDRFRKMIGSQGKLKIQKRKRRNAKEVKRTCRNRTTQKSNNKHNFRQKV